ncbi:MAG: holo-ACP synthase [bacterium]|nr:holo-ACP synthase [bacterium]
MSKYHLGVGVDIERIDRFRMLDRVTHYSFLERIFTRKEQDYCFSKKDPAPHLAARFCAKEAVVKTLAGIGIHKVSRRDIEIINTSKGVPRIRLHTKYKDLKMQVSMSHAGDYAVAFVISA